MSHRKTLLAALLGCAVPLLVSAAEWPQWRGPDGQGHIAGSGYPLTWSETENVVWKTEIPGRGHSSPVVDGNQVWITSAIDAPISEEKRQAKLKANTGNQPLTLVGELSLRAVCVDRATGKLIHDIEVTTDDDPDWTHQINTFASPSPVLEDGRLYCCFGAHGSGCVDTQTGKVVWTNKELKIQHENGPGSSPVIWGDLYIVHCDGSDKQYVAALNKRTGQLAWKTPRSGAMNENPQLRKAYGTPLVARLGGRDQLLSPGADWLYSYDPATGEELWKLNYETLGFSIVPRPVVHGDMIYMSTSFMRPHILGIRVDAAGGAPKVAWRYDKAGPQIPSPILVGDALYFVNDKGVATCLDAKTGELHWEARLGGNFAASPSLADGRLYFHNRDGKTFV
ncbi:MAG: PQQ-binding-like beta-propeller repeat protein, partial [Planctomycetales bacterium]|nr:PQQ-binding-like beta-propeller repeat protein [Planctomycetales bacterium]